MTPFLGIAVKEGLRGEQREKALAVLGAALEAADPASAVRRHLRREESRLLVEGQAYNLSRFRRVLIVGAGKGSAAMAQAVEEILGDFITSGLVVVKYAYGVPTQKIEIKEAGHPLPDQAGVEAAKQIVEIVQGAGEEDLIFVLLSGGGSALLVNPVPGVSLEDKVQLTQALLRSGAKINEINALRKHLSQVKGGQLARLAHPATVVALILSDVVGDPLDVIASGPTVPDPTTFGDAGLVLEKYSLLDQVPQSIIEHLHRGQDGQVAETPKAGDPVLTKVQNVLVGNNRQAAEAALHKAKDLGFNSLLLSTYMEGEAREVGRVLGSLAREVLYNGEPVAPPACLILGGETTVTVRGGGVGGRNQEMALSAALATRGLDGVMVVCSSTDGTDGPTDAAGAIAEGDTVGRALKMGLDPQKFLAENDSYHLFQALGDLIITGPTKTNVNDLAMVFIF